MVDSSSPLPAVLSGSLRQHKIRKRASVGHWVQKLEISGGNRTNFCGRNNIVWERISNIALGAGAVSHGGKRIIDLTAPNLPSQTIQTDHGPQQFRKVAISFGCVRNIGCSFIDNANLEALIVAGKVSARFPAVI